MGTLQNWKRPKIPPRTNKAGLRVQEQRKPIRNRGGRYHKSSRTRDESQRIAGQAYSRAYNTPFKSSRLQGIPDGHTVPFHSSATPRPASGPGRNSHPSHDPDCQKTVYRQIQSRGRLHFVRSIQRGFRLRGVQPLSHSMTASPHCPVGQPNLPVMRINGSSRTELNYCHDESHIAYQ